MPTTPKLAIPYVASTDLLSAFPTTDAAAATAVENAITKVTRYSRNTTWVTASAGWSITTQNLDSYFGCIWLFSIVCARTGAPIAVPANGDISSQIVGTFPAINASAYGPISPGANGRMSQWVLSNTSLILQAVAPGSDIATNESLTCVGMYLANVA
jgi:hypothetical protein